MLWPCKLMMGLLSQDLPNDWLVCLCMVAYLIGVTLCELAVSNKLSRFQVGLVPRACAREKQSVLSIWLMFV